ncbi:hypothetical protein Tco_1346885 [Tanacetum coccineum]
MLKKVVRWSSLLQREPLVLYLGGMDYPNVACELWQRGDVLELKDSAPRSTCDIHQLLRTVHVALLCVQDSATDRPTTSDMISMLLNDTISLPTPNNPPYAMVRRELTFDKPNLKLQDFSVNSMSITIMDGR